MIYLKKIAEMGRLRTEVSELTEKHEVVFEEFSNKLKEMEEKQEKSYQSLVDRFEMMSEKINHLNRFDNHVEQNQRISINFKEMAGEFNESKENRDKYKQSHLEMISAKINSHDDKIHSILNKLKSMGKQVTEQQQPEPVICQVIIE